MLWIKALHIVFVVAWFAGLLYLPRLFVYHCEVADTVGYERFCTMERRLYVMTTIGMLGTWVFGLALVALVPTWLQAGWLHAKLALVVALSGYHGWLKLLLRGFAERRNTRPARFYRLINEVPTLALLAIVALVVVKPF